MDSVINLKLLSHPMNWITVLIWLFIVGFATCILHLNPKGA